jgi:Holliday junction resolvase RusA-like endonuclease
MSTVSFTVQGRTVSTNQAYRRRKGHGLFKSAEGVDFTQRIQYAARIAMRGRELLRGPLQVELHFWFTRDAQDIDGGIKPVLDAMQPFVYRNDREIVSLYVEKGVDPGRPRVEVRVVETSPTVEREAAVWDGPEPLPGGKDLAAGAP